MTDDLTYVGKLRLWLRFVLLVLVLILMGARY